MKEHPILFSTPMVKAILDGRKTMTRRVMKPQPIHKDIKLDRGFDKYWEWKGEKVYEVVQKLGGIEGFFRKFCPYGYEGDLLWVRETTCIAPKRFATPDETCMPDNDGDQRYVSFKADGHSEDAMRDYGLKWTPSIHVPKWVVRIWLKVKSVRAEQLLKIPEWDAKAEGIENICDGTWGWRDYSKENPIDLGKHTSIQCLQAVSSFKTLWDSINGKPRKDGQDISWNANPWVWVVEFERTEKPKAEKEEK